VFDDRYEVLSKLGSGGMADVYLANDRLLDRQVALKILSSRYANDEQFIERFRREASSAASLNHPNIVQIYDRGEAEGTYYIAMEYLEGRSLKDIILKYAPLSPELVVSVSLQILEALRFAHRRDGKLGFQLGEEAIESQLAEDETAAGVARVRHFVDDQRLTRGPPGRFRARGRDEAFQGGGSLDVFARNG
jgi:serine/threonine protein kinase